MNDVLPLDLRFCGWCVVEALVHNKTDQAQLIARVGAELGKLSMNMKLFVFQMQFLIFLIKQCYHVPKLVVMMVM